MKIIQSLYVAVYQQLGLDVLEPDSVPDLVPESASEHDFVPELEADPVPEHVPELEPDPVPELVPELEPERFGYCIEVDVPMS